MVLTPLYRKNLSELKSIKAIQNKHGGKNFEKIEKIISELSDNLKWPNMCNWRFLKGGRKNI